MDHKLVTVLLLVIVMLHGTNGIFRRRRRCTVVHCMWSQWGAWSSCSVPCGTGGTSTRTRHVALLQQCGGFPCGGSSAETKPCNRFCNNGGKPLSKSCDCRGLPYYGTCCQTGCVTSSWGAWSECSATCQKQNGVMSRSRKVASSSACSSYKKETKDCKKICGEKECVTGSWGRWSECSATCEKQTGTSFRTRTVLSAPVCTNYGKEEKTCMYKGGNKCGEHGNLDRYGKCECNYRYYGKCCEKRWFDSKRGSTTPVSPLP